MKKPYEKPEINVIIFETLETITDQEGFVPDLSGEEGFEEW